MFTLNFNQKLFRLDQRLFSSQIASKLAQNVEEVAQLKTLVDKNKQILRQTSTGLWESVIGLEVHAQINAKSKLFSSAPHEFNSPVNSNVSYFDASIPGTLPVLNRRCVEAGILTSLALGSRLNMTSFFDRKHYFYSDLPAGYQITQQRTPLAVGGTLCFPVLDSGLSRDAYQGSSSIVQLQLEQDSGKSLHDEEGGRSLVDLNRCGAGLMEIVFGPDLRHGEEAAALVKELVLVLEKLDTCKARMERGELRVDANISVRRPGEELGVRTEVKNLNSIRSVARAIEYEVARQVMMLEQGGVVENETRSFDLGMKKTLPMRDKEAKQDYRFMPEPNLPPLRLVDDNTDHTDMINISPIRSTMPELPAQTRSRLSDQFGLSLVTAAQLVEWPDLLDYFFHCVTFSPNSYKELADLVFTVVQENSNQTGLPALEIKLKPEVLVKASNMRQAREISYTGMQEVLGMVLRGDTREVIEIVKDRDLFLIRDRSYIENFVREIIELKSDMVEKHNKETNKKKQGKIFQALMREVNKDPRVEKVDMAAFSQIFKKMLEDSS
eukprot:GFUD01029912.1.p1 GENE.GFUD01029912.1~~GFUD01029912.1.p1  ORF type:complete len:553 (+),score=205.74 GFUD01029912.1:39-1697(+)